MNNSIKYAGTFIGGLILGSVAGGYLVYKYIDSKFNQKLTEEIKKAELYFKEMGSTLKENSERIIQNTEKKSEKSAVKIQEETDRVSDNKQYNVLAETYSRNNERVDYNQLSSPKEKVDLSAYEHPEDSEDRIVPINKNVWESATARYDKKEMTYYDGDKILVDDESMEIVDPDVTCGEVAFHHFSEYEANMSYTRNYDTGADYAVHRVYRCYNDPD